MNGSGCKSCPVKNCFAQYRGSTCSAERAKHGLGDPMTNGDRIRAMTDEELADNVNCLGCPESQEIISCSKFGSCRDCWLGWLQQPVKEDAE